MVLRTEDRDGVRYLIMNRPEVHNAFNPELISSLTEALRAAESDGAVRMVVITGEGRSFSAGADLNWMKESVTYSEKENYEDAMAMAEMFHTIRCLKKPVLARVNGAAIGGGMGIVAASDISVASEKAVFGFSEVKLGLVPAVISPYIVARIGEARARELFITGRRFDAKAAQAMGLVNMSVPHEELDSTVGSYIRDIRTSGPRAVAAAKALLDTVAGFDPMKEETSHIIATLRASEEGQEGISAFLEKRKPGWYDV